MTPSKFQRQYCHGEFTYEKYITHLLDLSFLWYSPHLKSFYRPIHSPITAIVTTALLYANHPSGWYLIPTDPGFEERCSFASSFPTWLCSAHQPNDIHFLTFWTTRRNQTRSRVTPKRIIVRQPVKKCPEIHGPRRFITAYLRNPPFFPILSQINPVHTLPSYCIHTYFNIMLTSAHNSSKWFFYFRIHHVKPTRVTSSVQLILLKIRRT